MIKANFLKSQAAKARTERRTPAFLRRLVGASVDGAARHHYGDAYAIKCLQTSWAVKTLLSDLGIGSRVWLGALCAAEVYEEWGHDGWGGFWGADHHVWLVTEFNELVDLSIAELHRHPVSRRSDGIPIPPLWWETLDSWPPVIRYLPDSVVGNVALSPPEMSDLDAFTEATRARCSSLIAERRVDQISFGPFLESVDSMNRLHETGHPWLTRAIAFQDFGKTFPAWIREREAELIAAFRAGQAAPSRLAAQPGLTA
jgi:hypothetical protein